MGVLAGGSSGERSVSLRSGRAVQKALKHAGFNTLWLDPARGGLRIESLARIDVAFLALHGKGGEDGSLQGFLEDRGIPYIGSAPKPSLQAFDKGLSKRVFERFKVPTAAWTVLKGDSLEKKAREFPAPFFIKPIREGSSIGVFEIRDASRQMARIRSAFRRYGALLAERKIEGREFTVGILGNRALPVIELKPKRTFYDYKAKYTKGMTEYRVPAPVSAAVRRRLQRVALKAHRALGLRDFSRVDMMADSKGHLYVLEANSIPGFTELSLLPKAARAAGCSFEELCFTLVKWAYERSLRSGVGLKNRI